MKPKYITSILTIPNGSQEASSRDALVDSSESLHLVSASLSHDEDVSISIKDGSNEVIPFIPITFFDGKQGAFDERALELDTNTKKNYTINAIASENVSQATTITLVFKIYQ